MKGCTRLSPANIHFYKVHLVLSASFKVDFVLISSQIRAVKKARAREEMEAFIVGQSLCVMVSNLLLEFQLHSLTLFCSCCTFLDEFCSKWKEKVKKEKGLMIAMINKLWFGASFDLVPKLANNGKQFLGFVGDLIIHHLFLQVFGMILSSPIIISVTTFWTDLLSFGRLES